jgi:hypothetical protein
LHAESHLILRDARLDFRIADFSKLCAFISESVSSMGAPLRGRDAVGILQIEHGIAHGPQRHAAEFAGKKPLFHMRVKSACAIAFELQFGREHDKGGQIIALAAETVG